MSYFGSALVNPETNKALSLPFFNLKDKYAKNFHLSWLGFFIAFFSWFAFPPLMDTIAKDLKLSKIDIQNSNVLGLTSTLFVRLVSGTLCDRFGPRYVMAGLLLLGAIPTALAGLVTNVTGLMVLRFFIGVLGGTFVPCQVWTTTFFDKSIVGQANALAGGWGNAGMFLSDLGGGAVFFVMPAVVESLIRNSGMTPSVAWRVAFPAVPFVLITSTAIMILVFGDDCPEGRWIDRKKPTEYTQENITAYPSNEKDGSTSSMSTIAGANDQESQTVVLKSAKSKDEPTEATLMEVVLSPQTWLAFFPYACTFGAEIAIEGILSTWYIQQSKVNDLHWEEVTAGAWAALFGLLNIVTRPLGGYLADVFYRGRTVDVKKWWMISLGVVEGITFLILGFQTHPSVYVLIAWMTVLALAMEIGNGANYALVPHLNPTRNGLVSGIVGAGGNFGGILFSCVIRFNGGAANFPKSMWISGIITLGLHLMICWIPVTPKKRK